MQIRTGTVIDGKYEIKRQIGKGGMSVVYLATDKRLNKPWAVKEIRKNAAVRGQRIAADSLIAEADLMKRLDHPALPRIVDIIEDEHSLYIVMDYIEGESLETVLKKYGPCPEKTVLRWAVQIADALWYLHSQNPPIIYRDMKPANVILKPNGDIKIIDFGIAREYKKRNCTDTTVLGTRGYAPPEQHGARQTDARSDIYALGMTMHHLLTGVDPRAADYEYQPVRRLKPGLSEATEKIIDKCTALDPRDRYQSCRLLIEDLRNPAQVRGKILAKKKRRFYLFLILLLLSAGLGITGAAVQIFYRAENSRTYEKKLNAVGTHEEKVEKYLEAIDLDGTDPRAYIRLLKEYQDDGVFGDEQSRQFSSRYNENRDRLYSSTEDLDLAYEAGITYFYFYTGSDHSFRSRILYAKPYFDLIVDSGDRTYERYETACSYQILADFYDRYVVNSGSDAASASAGIINEPLKEDYEKLIDSLWVCIDNLEADTGAGAAYTKLTFYREVSNLLNDHRGGFAAAGVEEQKVQDLLTGIRDRTRRISVAQDGSVKLRERILEDCAVYAENIGRTYRNIRKERDVGEAGLREAGETHAGDF